MNATPVSASRTSPLIRPLHRTRSGRTRAFNVAGQPGYLISAAAADGKLGELRLVTDKTGGTVAGMTDALSAAISLGLQHGVPLEHFAAKLGGLIFEPYGPTDDPDIPVCTSLVDYVIRRLVLDETPPAGCDRGKPREPRTP